MQFYDLLNSLIHTNNSLNSIQRFHYLRSSLQGETAQVITDLEVSADNYEVTWQLLKQRFGNHKLIINNHVEALFELSSITREFHVNSIIIKRCFKTFTRITGIKSAHRSMGYFNDLSNFLKI